MTFVPNSTWITIGLIVGAIVASGPAVPMVDLGTQRDAVTDNTHVSEASISIASPPSGKFRIAQGRFGSGPYLYAPSVTVRIGAISGDPILVYEVAIRGLGYNAAELVFLGTSDAGRVRSVAIDRPTVDRGTLREQTYDAIVSVRVRVEGGPRIVYTENVTVWVEDNVDD